MRYPQSKSSLRTRKRNTPRLEISYTPAAEIFGQVTNEIPGHLLVLN